MTIDCQVFEKCICQTTSAIDEGALKMFLSNQWSGRRKPIAVVLFSPICALARCSSNYIPLFLSVFPLSPSAYVLTTAGALQ